MEETRTNITIPIRRIDNVIVGVNRVYTGGSPQIGLIEEFPGIIDELEMYDGDLQFNQCTSIEI